LVELPSQHRLIALAGGDAVDAYLWWVSPSLPSVHAETGLSQVQILPARPKINNLEKNIDLSRKRNFKCSTNDKSLLKRDVVNSQIFIFSVYIN
jgi:hypothetical protein